MEVRPHTVQLGSHDFRWSDWGESTDPPIVFLHGVFTNGPMYGALLERVAAAGRWVVALDQRGHGQSAHTGDYESQLFVDDLISFWERLGLGSAGVIGHSMGGGHATRFAAQRPAEVARLALLDMPFWLQSSAEDQLPFWLACAELAPNDGFDSVDSYLAAVARLFPRSSAGAAALSGIDLEQSDDLRWRWRRPADPAVAGGRDYAQAEWGPILADVSCPVLVTRAAESEVFAGSAAELAAAFPSATAVEVPDSGHMVMWENVDGWADTLVAFFK